jgi:hypothetical protein
MNLDSTGTERKHKLLVGNLLDNPQTPQLKELSTDMLTTQLVNYLNNPSHTDWACVCMTVGGRYSRNCCIHDTYFSQCTPCTEEAKDETLQYVGHEPR